MFPRDHDVPDGVPGEAHTCRCYAGPASLNGQIILTGSPWETRSNAGFNRTHRHDVHDAEWFATDRQARVEIDIWLKQDTDIPPHEPLGMRPPVPETP
ncbi:MAG: hypothetical protein AAGI50_00930 [Pseudomonadota bacterium]